VVRGGGAAVFGALCGPWLGRVVWSGRRSAALFLFALAFRCACVYSMRPGGLKFSRPLQPFPAPCSIPPKRFEGDCATRSGGRCSLVLCVALGSRSRVLRLRAVFLFNLFAALFSRLNLNEN